jgi:hypothetical protein
LIKYLRNIFLRIAIEAAFRTWGIDFMGGVTFDLDDILDSGFFKNIPNEDFGGFNYGEAFGGGYVARELEGFGESIDVNGVSFSPTILFDEESINGFVVTFGPGFGTHWSKGYTNTFTIRDAMNSLGEFIK